MSEEVRKTQQEHYRALAVEMLKKADEAATEESRRSYLVLAASWGSLANSFENAIY